MRFVVSQISSIYHSSEVIIENKLLRYSNITNK